MALSEQACLERLKQSLNHIHSFYKEDLLIYRGKTSDTDKLYNEVASEFVLDHLDYFERIPEMKKTEVYITEKYKQFDRNQSNYHTQKQLTLKIYDQNVYDVGKIIDCQTPLIDGDKLDTIDKIDLLLHTNSRELFILNVKKPNSEQSILRHIVEGVIQLSALDRLKLLDELGLDLETKVSFAPLIFKNATPFIELASYRPELYRLMSAIGLEIFMIDNHLSPYRITRHHHLDFATDDIKKTLQQKAIV